MVEGAGLENQNRGNSIEGSNPSLTATQSRQNPRTILGSCKPRNLRHYSPRSLPGDGLWRGDAGPVSGHFRPKSLAPGEPVEFPYLRRRSLFGPRFPDLAGSILRKRASEGAKGSAADEVLLGIEQVVDGAVGGEKALG